MPFLGPGRLVHHQACGLDLSRHVGKVCGDHLVPRDHDSKGLALVRVLQRHLIGTLCDAECLSGDADSGVIQGIHGDWEALADLTEHILHRNPAILEHQRAGVRTSDAEFVLLLADRESLKGLLDDERRRPTVLLDAEVRMVHILCEENVEVSTHSIGHPHLLSGEEIVRSVIRQFGLAGHGRSIGARTGFGQRIGTDLVLCELGQIPLFLILGSMQRDRLGAQPDVNTVEDGEGGVDASQFLDDDRLGDVIERHTAVFLGNRARLQTVFDELRPLLDWRLLGFVAGKTSRGEHLLGEIPHHLPNHALFFAVLEVHMLASDRSTSLSFITHARGFIRPQDGIF